VAISKAVNLLCVNAVKIKNLHTCIRYSNSFSVEFQMIFNPLLPRLNCDKQLVDFSEDCLSIASSAATQLFAVAQEASGKG
jgi:hypothetical protein